MSTRDKTTTLLAVFGELEEASAACRVLRENGFKADEISVISEFPYPEGVFAAAEPRCFLQWITLIGGALGIVTGIVLTVGMSLLYPIRTGHMSIFPAPPYGIITYEFMMLFAIVSTVIGFGIATLRGYHHGTVLFDPHLREDHTGVLVLCENESAVILAKQVFHAMKTVKVHEAPGRHIR